MKLAAAAAAALAFVTLAAPSLACRVRPVPRPVTPVVAPDPRPSGGEVQRLLRAADDADAAASREEITARTTIRRAESLHQRADAALERAGELRARARDLRARAGVGSGGVWRRRASPDPFGGSTI